MAAAVVQADNRCVGGGGDLPPAAAAASATIEQQTADDDRKRIDGARNGRSSSSLSSLSSLSSNDDDDDDDNHDHRHRRRRRRGSVNDATAGNGQMVAVKRLKYLKQRVIDLDDLELLDRHLDNAAIDDAGAEALYGADVGALAADLRQKNKDLVLAARLGKALLAKNDELSLMNERLAEEYGDKLEEIEQDRHWLRRQLAQARAECEQKCHELQADLRDLQAVLDNREHQLRESDKQKRAVVRELTDQNGRLQSHIRELSQAEAELRNKCRLLEDSHQSQYVNGKWNNGVGTGSPTSITNGGGSTTTDYGSLTPDDYRSLDVLRDEIDMKSAEKQRLQKRMAELRADRDRLAELLELKDHTLAEYRAEAAHYEHRSAMLAKQLDDVLCTGGGTDAWKSRGEKCASCNGIAGGSGRTVSQPGMSLLDELEQVQAATAQPQPRMVDVDLTRRQLPFDEPTTGQIEVSDVERWAVRLCDALERRLELSADTRYRLLKLISTGGGVSADDGDGKPSSAGDLAELLRNRDGRVAELTCELSVRDTELQAAREERDLAIQDKMDAMRIRCVRCGGDGEGNERDADDAEEKNSSLIPELLRKAWEQRDGAVRRKNTVQVQLARTRVDILQANGQLMEAIGQKVELSQQLEQWQMDMQALLDEQMRRKLLAPAPSQSTAAGGTPDCGDGGGNNKCSATGAFPSMSSSSLGSLGSSGLMNSLLMIAGGGGANANR